MSPWAALARGLTASSVDRLGVEAKTARWSPRSLLLSRQLLVGPCSEALDSDGVVTVDLLILLAGLARRQDHCPLENQPMKTGVEIPSSPISPPEAKMIASAGKVMVTSFSDSHGMVYQHVVPAHISVSDQYYRAQKTTFA